VVRAVAVAAASEGEGAYSEAALAASAGQEGLVAAPEEQAAAFAVAEGELLQEAKALLQKTQASKRLLLVLANPFLDLSLHFE
jgi:hypothetical protein